MANADYNSDFDFGSDRSSQPDLRPPARLNPAGPPVPVRAAKGHQSQVVAEFSREEWRRTRPDFLAMNAYDRHKKMVNDYIRFYGGRLQDFARDATADRRDADVVSANHRFLWRETDAEKLTWEQRVAKRYWDKLYKEYCLADLSLYRENKIALRWRVEREVAAGKGQFVCGNKRCSAEDGLRSWEVNFGYVEAGQKKNALVKVRLCPPCSRKLNHCKARPEVKRRRRRRERDEEETTAKRGRREEEEKEEEKKKEEEVAADVWSRPVEANEEKTVEEEIDDYLDDMFL